MNFQHRALAISLLLVASCSGCLVPPPQPGPLHVNPGARTTAVVHASKEFTPKERRDIEAAAINWEDQTGGIASIQVKWDLEDVPETDSPKLFRLTSDDQAVKMLDSQGCSASNSMCILGWIDTPGGIHNLSEGPVSMYFVVDRLTYRLTRVAMHEMGHLLGMKHVADPYALLYPHDRPNKGACLTMPDISEFCRVNMCGSTRMHPCEN